MRGVGTERGERKKMWSSTRIRGEWFGSVYHQKAYILQCSDVEALPPSRRGASLKDTASIGDVGILSLSPLSDVTVKNELSRYCRYFGSRVSLALILHFLYRSGASIRERKETKIVGNIGKTISLKCSTTLWNLLFSVIFIRTRRREYFSVRS